MKCERLTQVDKGYLSEPRRIEFPTAGGATAHMHFYPPGNRDFRAMPGELPPLRVHVHGGPTAEAGDELQLVHQFWTSRGAHGCFSSRLTCCAMHVMAGVVGGQLRAHTLKAVSAAVSSGACDGNNRGTSNGPAALHKLSQCLRYCECARKTASSGAARVMWRISQPAAVLWVDLQGVVKLCFNAEDERSAKDQCC